MKQFTLYLLLIVFLYSGCASTQLPNDTISPCGINLYYSLGGLGEEVKSEFQEENFTQVLLINQRRIVVKGNEWAVDKNILTDFVIKKLPDEDSKLVVVLNWEGEVYDEIQRGPSSPNYTQASALFIKAYKIVKELRPKSKVGYYGFPIRDYWNRNDGWRARNRVLDDFLKKFDVLFPSIYDFYDSSAQEGAGDLAYVKENIEEAIRVGQRIGKPVVAFVWHRYHPSNKNKSKELIPLEEFSGHVAEAARAQVQGKSIDGVVWWGSEYSMFARANLKRIPREELRTTWEKEAKQTLPVYFQVLRNAVNSACQN
ncbi:MAG: hypothetical protein ACJAS3_002687 [Roseivirga sp.]|jgi:hypothetical protein